MMVIMVAVLTMSADDMNVRLSAMLTRSRMPCSAERTAGNTNKTYFLTIVSV